MLLFPPTLVSSSICHETIAQVPNFTVSLPAAKMDCSVAHSSLGKIKIVQHESKGVRPSQGASLLQRKSKNAAREVVMEYLVEHDI